MLALAEKQQTFRKLEFLLLDRKWRLNNLYFIQDAEGNKIKFRFNWAQEDFYKNIWYFNAILKARQLGFSTFILIYILDAILFNPNKTAGLIAHSLDDAQKLFKRVKFAYDNLPEEIKKMVPATQDSAKSLAFGNGSSISVGTSLRSGTLQYLHISEYGKIAAKYPEKANEIKTGALNTVAAGQQIFIESTAEGKEGEFYELCQRAQELQQQNAKLTPLDPKFHFYPWYKNESYVLHGDIKITQELEAYFNTLPFELTHAQKAWYSKKAESMGDDMLREFPSTPEESFLQSIEGCIYAKEMAFLRREGRITSVPWIPSLPVNTWWDLGTGDYTTITFKQRVGKETHLIDYYENSGEGYQHYAEVLKSKPYTYGTHYWPHDGRHREPVYASEKYKVAMNFGIRPIMIVKRAVKVMDDIDVVRNSLPMFWIDDTKCDKLIRHLSNYRKLWNPNLGTWRDTPRHDEASHGADSVRTGVLGDEDKPMVKKEKREKRGWEDW